MRDIQPTHLIFLGDTWDCGPLNHWDMQSRFKEKGLERIRRELKDESRGLRHYVQSIAKACGKRLKEVVYFEGNHEAWISQYQAIYGSAGDPLTLQGFLLPKETGITKVVGQGNFYALGHLRYLHGENYNGSQLGGICKRMVDDYEACVVFGHFHGVAEASKASVVHAEEKKFAKCIGTMGHMNPAYNKNKPHQWQNAFHVAFFREGGFFNDYVVRIIGGKFIAPNGKLYV